MTSNTPARLVALAEAIEYARVSHITLWRWRKDGRITGYRNEMGRVFIDLDEIDHLTRPVAS